MFNRTGDQIEEIRRCLRLVHFGTSGRSAANNFISFFSHSWRYTPRICSTCILIGTSAIYISPVTPTTTYRITQYSCELGSRVCDSLGKDVTSQSHVLHGAGCAATSICKAGDGSFDHRQPSGQPRQEDVIAHQNWSSFRHQVTEATDRCCFQQHHTQIRRNLQRIAMHRW